MGFVDIILKIFIGMLGLLFFLRISGKTQMAQLTPLDSVNAFVTGALVGGIIYNPNVSLWQLLFALATWTALNMTIRYCLRVPFLRRILQGNTVLIIKNGQLNLKEFRRNKLEMEQFRTLLRENGIFSMFDVENARFETNGKLTISLRSARSESYLFVNDGSISEDNLKQAGKSAEWLKKSLRELGYPEPEELFCVEWTPDKGFYISPKNEDSDFSGKGYKTPRTAK